MSIRPCYLECKSVTDNTPADFKDDETVARKHTLSADVKYNYFLYIAFCG